MLQEAVHMYMYMPLNIQKSLIDVETTGGRDSEPRRFAPKMFAPWPRRKPSLSDRRDPWWCWHGAVVRAEQTEDTPRGNNQSIKREEPLPVQGTEEGSALWSLPCFGT